MYTTVHIYLFPDVTLVLNVGRQMRPEPGAGEAMGEAAANLEGRGHDGAHAPRDLLRRARPRAAPSGRRGPRPRLQLPGIAA